jgi:hypothetical protein
MPSTCFAMPVGGIPTRFIGAILSKRLKNDGFWVRGGRLKFPEDSETNADDFVVGDLRDQGFCRL